MLGSSIIEIWVTENGKTEKIVFTGDLGNNDIPLLSEPTMIEDADFLVMESTYGSRKHIKNDQKAEMFDKLNRLLPRIKELDDASFQLLGAPITVDGIPEA